MMETFAAAFSKTSPPSNTRVTPKPEPSPGRVHASRMNATPEPSNASTSAHTEACISHTNRSKSFSSTPFKTSGGSDDETEVEEEAARGTRGEPPRERPTVGIERCVLRDERRRARDAAGAEGTRGRRALASESIASGR